MRGMQKRPEGSQEVKISMAGDEIQDVRYVGSKLWRGWDNTLSRVGGFLSVLRRYGAKLQRRVDHRQDRYDKGVLKRKLQMGRQPNPATEQKEQPLGGIRGGGFNLRGSRRKDWAFSMRDNGQVEQRDDRRSSGGEHSSFLLWDRARCDGQKTVEEVFDLVDCGPRHRFLIRNAVGEVFISSNSAGHGLNLQKSNASHIVFYSTPWSSEQYIQAIGRVARSGNKAQTVFVHHMVAENTLETRVIKNLKKHLDLELELVG